MAMAQAMLQASMPRYILNNVKANLATHIRPASRHRNLGKSRNQFQKPSSSILRTHNHGQAALRRPLHIQSTT
jgi:hypothetical protein